MDGWVGERPLGRPRLASPRLGLASAQKPLDSTHRVRRVGRSWQSRPGVAVSKTRTMRSNPARSLSPYGVKARHCAALSSSRWS